MKSLSVLLVAWLSAWVVPAAAALPEVILEMRDGVLLPARLEIPAQTRVKITLRNTGQSPVEFESLRLRQEKVLGPGVTSFVVINPLKPGEYEFFDEFHLPDAKGVIVVK